MGLTLEDRDPANASFQGLDAGGIEIAFGLGGIGGAGGAHISDHLADTGDGAIRSAGEPGILQTHRIDLAAGVCFAGHTLCIGVTGDGTHGVEVANATGLHGQAVDAGGIKVHGGPGGIG